MSLPTSIYPQKPKQLPPSLGFSTYALEFDNIDDYVDTVTLALDDITVMVLFKAYSLPTVAEERMMIINDQSYDRWRIFIKEPNLLAVQVKDSGGTLYSFQGAIEANRWYHAAFSHKSVAVGGLNLTAWLNGIVLGRAATTGALALPADTIRIGRGIKWNTDWYFDGAIAEVRIFDWGIVGPPAGFSSPEIISHMLQYTKPASGCRMWLRFEEGTGLTAYDSSGYGNHGSLLPTADPPKWIRTKKWELRAELGL